MKALIKLLLVLIFIALGGAIALLTQARMTHLRQLPGLALPDWSAAVQDQASLSYGAATLAGSATWPAPSRLQWQFAGLGMKGAQWDLKLLGAGLTFDADLRVPPRYRVGVIDALSAEYDYIAPKLRGIRADLSWLGAGVNGQALGQGSMQLISDPQGKWRAPFQITGDVVTVRGTLTGRLDQDTMVVEAVIADAGAMPEEWKRILNVLVRPDADGWKIQRRMRLPF
ncbi:MAG: hypothetical protein CSA68_06215 [Rhodobacterales bacterium]|nr:MAG: hypothetical protein CSA68_06215 [Rhodobacterales bacterium]